MSYARFGWGGSDVYVFMGSRGIECCGCLLQEREWVPPSEDALKKTGPLAELFAMGTLRPVGEEIQTVFTSTDDAVAHMHEHRKRGHHVPENVIPDLLADAEDNEQYLRTGIFMWQRCMKQTGPQPLDICDTPYTGHADKDHEFVKDWTLEQREALQVRNREKREARKRDGGA